MLKLGLELAFEDLYRRDGLWRLDDAFNDSLKEADPELAARLEQARLDPDSLEAKAESELLIALAPHLEDFLGELFDVRRELSALSDRHHDLAPLYRCKRLFVQRRAAKAVKADQAEALDGDRLSAELSALGVSTEDELAFARQVEAWGEDEATNAEPLESALHYAAWALHSPVGRARHADGVLFKQPHKTDPEHLVSLSEEDRHGASAVTMPEDHMRRREGFALTDAGMDLKAALDHAHYCIFCHNQGKDSCSRGLREKAAKDAPADQLPAFKSSHFGVPLAGCPLDEKISEMHLLKTEGVPLGALAVAVVDNPMLAGTGHRICNDCMKACIYQKQDPVDIPQVETRTLKDILELPWGFEIYSLLTRWNPLNLRRPLPLPDSGRKVLIAGLGPAGSTLAHYLLNDGHTVFAIDGLKIEPLAPEVCGVDATGRRVPFEPIRDLESLREPLDQRVMAGFGGVAEYGITVRWDKTFLKVQRLLLERRDHFAMCGGVRLGGTITLDQAFEIGFDHVALALGAGKPTILDLPNGLAPGVRMASDFLMALQLTGAARADSIANLQVRLPAVVIGGGLTAIDTATEVLAYYPVQVEKFLTRYEALIAERGEETVRAGFRTTDLEVADEFLGHARAIRAERTAAEADGRPARVRELLEDWGGATIAYRRRLIDSPSYTLNHEEVAKALEEGVRFAEGLTPTAVYVDESGACRAVRLSRKTETGSEEVVLPARALLVAAGTRPNTVLAREDAENFGLDGRYFQALDEEGHPETPELSAKPSAARVLTKLREDGRAVSFFGDLHPSFAGNVVKAMGSAKQGWPVVSRLLGRLQEPATAETAEDFIARLNGDLRPTVEAVNRLTPTIVEVVVRAPAAARAFRPGQFYRLQNFETLAPKVEATTLAMEGLAMTGAWTDLDRGLIGTIMLEMGGSSDLGPLLSPGEPVILMGPTGAPTEIPQGETVLLAGGGLGNAVLFSIGRAMRENGCRVIYFAGYKAVRDRYKIEEIEAAADQVVWACDEEPGFAPSRDADLTFVGNIVAAMVAYQKGELGERQIDLSDVDRVIAIGSDRMMAAVRDARHGALAEWLKPDHEAIGSINSPMQCMMKEICAQCLQPHRDPESGEVSVVFSCFNQDQPLDRVDFQALHERLGQNAVQERLTAQWIDHCLKRMGVRTAA